MPELEIDSAFPDLLRAYFLDTGTGKMDHFILEDSAWRQSADASDPADPAERLADLCLVEVKDQGAPGAQLTEAVERIGSGRYLAGAVVVGDLSAARLLARTADKREGWRATVLGVDPDYFFGLIPLHAPGHWRIELFVQSLKSAHSPAERVRRFIKRCLIMSRFSSPLYEYFVVILEGPRCS